jgi:hypothetical protein
LLEPHFDEQNRNAAAASGASRFVTAKPKRNKSADYEFIAAGAWPLSGGSPSSVEKGAKPLHHGHGS